jgi:MFS transporter, FSR family, fosmidomycin resistance protein
MTQAVELPLRAERSAENRLIGGVCFGHFVSHFYIMLMAPLFVFIRADYDVSYTELGLALTAFNVVSTVVQTPMGFLVDRMSAGLLVIGGLVIGASAVAIAGLVHSFWVFVAAFGLLGLANTVYHPAGYALLSHHVEPARAGRVFSFHTFAGMAGNAVTPPTLIFLYGLVGWRGAYLAAAALGLVAALALVWVGEPGTPAHAARPRKDDGTAAQQLDGWRLLMSPAIFTNLVFFILLSFCGGGLNNYLVVGLGALHGTARRGHGDASRHRQYGAYQPADHECRRRSDRGHAGELYDPPRFGRCLRADDDGDRLRLRSNAVIVHACGQSELAFLLGPGMRQCSCQSGDREIGPGGAVDERRNDPR